MESGHAKQTIRQQIIDLLGTEELTLRDLSQAVGIPEKEVMIHLGHIGMTLRNQGKQLVETPYKCLSCGYIFEGRSRFNRPGRCPKCKKSHIRSASYRID